MEARTRQVAAAWLVLLAWATSGCEQDDPDAARAPGAAVDAAGADPVERPHFRGSRDLGVALTRTDDQAACVADGAPVWACGEQADGPVLADRRAVRLVEARMDTAGGGTSWTVTLRFDPDDRAALAPLGERAERSGARVLVLDDGGEVLAPGSRAAVSGDEVALPRLTKPEAWDLVERLSQE